MTRYWDEAWSLVEGCAHKSPGCDNCWSESATAMRACQRNPAIRARYGELTEGGRFTGDVRLMHGDLDKPLRRRKPRTFAVWNDLFHEGVEDEFIDRALAVMALCPQHRFIVLTKRARRMRDHFYFVDRQVNVGNEALHLAEAHGLDWDWRWRKYTTANNCESRWPLPNLWLGVTVENKDAMPRVDDLRNTPAAVRILSCEPLLGYLDGINLDGIDWVIAGGETGPNARPMHPDWVRELRDQCQAAGTAFFFKQWGEFLPDDHFQDAGIEDNPDASKFRTVAYIDGDWEDFGYPIWSDYEDYIGDAVAMGRVTANKSGAILDGHEHHELPGQPG